MTTGLDGELEPPSLAAGDVVGWAPENAPADGWPVVVLTQRGRGYMVRGYRSPVDHWDFIAQAKDLVA